MTFGCFGIVFIKNIKSMKPAYYVLIALAVSVSILWLLFKRNKKKKEKDKINSYDSYLAQKKSEIKTITFVTARNAIASLERNIPNSYTQRNELHQLYVENLIKTILSVDSFKNLFSIFACFEVVNDKDLLLWNDVKTQAPQIIPVMEKLVTAEVARLKSVSTKNISESDRADWYVIAEGLHWFVRQGFLGPKKGTPLEEDTRTLRDEFAKKSILLTDSD